MTSRFARVALGAAALALTLAGCEVALRFHTTVDADGSGRFSFGMTLDRELVDALEGAARSGVTRGSGLASVEGLFERLGSQGWAVERATPDGGLALAAEKAFADPEGFGRLIDELGGPGGADDLGIGGVQLELDYRTEPSFLQTRARFSGEFDTGSALGLDPQLQKLVQDLRESVRFEVSAEMPGAITPQRGSATVRDGTVTWRPALGSRLVFAAESSALKLGSLLAILLPVLGLIGVGAWVALGHRREEEPETPAGAIVLDAPLAAATPNGAATQPAVTIDLREQPARTESPPWSLP